MPSKKTAAQKTTRTRGGGVSRVAAEPEVEERRAVNADGDDTVVEPTDATTAAIPNVQAEPNSGSNAPEDVRAGAVADPNT